jgi:alkylhydroperoxidase family enzyme
VPRVPLLDAETAEGDASRALASAVGHMGVFRAMAHASTNIVPMMRLGRAILTEQKLDPRHRELVILLAMRLEGGTYEWEQHVDVARAVGATDADIEAIAELRLDDPSFTPGDRALLALGEAVVSDVRVKPDTFEAARQWFEPREIIEAIIAIGFYMILARLTEALEVDTDPIQGKAVLDSSRRSRPG